ncbi:MAG: PQQ-binding-like beta-propeller repeat protein, partial [Halobacteria archaeon]
NNGSNEESASIDVDTTAPTISDYSVTNPSGQDVQVEFTTDETLSTIKVDISGQETGTLNTADFNSTTGTVNATYSGSSDGSYTATLIDANDSSDNNGSNEESASIDVDTTAPSITSYTVTNPSSQDVQVEFTTDETLSTIKVDISGAESGTLNTADFNSTSGTVNATYSGSSDGSYTATLIDANDSSGNNGSSGESGSVDTDTSAPSISDYSVTNPSGQDVKVEFTTDESLSTIKVDISGAESGTLNTADFNSTTGTINVTYSGSSDGSYTATLIDANDSSGNNGSGGETETVSVDSTAPTITAYSVSNPSSKDVEVRFSTDEDLQSIKVDISGAESATLNTGDFNSTSGTVNVTYAGSSNGTYNATLIDANDSAGNNGSTGQSGSVTIGGIPTADIDIKTNSPETGSQVTFNGSNSSDPDGSITSYDWTINGTENSGEEVTQTFTDAGIYEAELNVTDDASKTDSVTTTFIVSNGSGAGVSGTVNNSGYQHNVESVVDSVSLNWSFDTGEPVNTSPAAVDGNVYVGSSTDKIYKIDRDNGSELWNFTAGDDVNGSPTVRYGTVYFGSNDDNLYAVDVETGEEEWNYSTGGDVESSPKIADRTVYFGGSDDKMYAVDAATGKKEWTYTTQGDVDASPAINDSTVYVASRGHKLYALDAGDGSVSWSFSGSQNFQPLLSAPAVVDGHVYVGSNDDHLYAVDENDGSEVWSYKSDDVIDSSPAVHNGTVYVGLAEGSLTALDADDGSNEWSRSMGESHSSPRFTSDTVYVGSNDDKIYAVDTGTGAELWNYTTNGNVVTGPALTNGSVYVTSMDGKLYSLNGSTTDVTDPVAELGSTYYSVDNDTNVEFDADSSSDAGGIKNYSWDFNNDSTEDASGKKVNHTFTSTGEHEVTLTVTDDAGNKDKFNVTVDVQSVDDGGSSGGDDGSGSDDSGDSGVGVSPKNLNFGKIGVGETKTLNVTIKNPSSTAGIQVSRSEIVGENRSAFTVTDGTDTPFTLGPGASHEVTVELSPTSKGVKNAQLQLFSNSTVDSQVDVWMTNEKTVLLVEQVETESVKVTGKNVKNNSKINLNVSQPDTRNADAGMDELNMTVNNEPDFEIYVNNSESSGSAPNNQPNGKENVKYIEIKHDNLPSSEIDNTSFTTRVKNKFTGVELYRYNTTAGEWRNLTVKKGRKGDKYTKYHVDTPGFSMFSVESNPTGSSGSGEDSGSAVGGGGSSAGVSGPIGQRYGSGNQASSSSNGAESSESGGSSSSNDGSAGSSSSGVGSEGSSSSGIGSGGSSGTDVGSPSGASGSGSGTDGDAAGSDGSDADEGTDEGASEDRSSDAGAGVLGVGLNWIASAAGMIAVLVIVTLFVVYFGRNGE